LLLLFGPLVAVVVFLLNRSGEDDEVAEMKARIDDLEAELAAEEADAGSRDAENGDDGAAAREAGDADTDTR
jgi:hypothetical protein